MKVSMGFALILPHVSPTLINGFDWMRTARNGPSYLLPGLHCVLSIYFGTLMITLIIGISCPVLCAMIKGLHQLVYLRGDGIAADAMVMLSLIASINCSAAPVSNFCQPCA